MLSSLFLFPNLKTLELSLDRFGFAISQRMLCAIAELRGLESCRITGGNFPPSSGLKLEVMGSYSLHFEHWHLFTPWSNNRHPMASMVLPHRDYRSSAPSGASGRYT